MRWIMIMIVLAFLISTFLMYDSGRGSRSNVPSTSADGNIQDYATAVINGRNIMRSELEAMVRSYVQQSNISNLQSTDIPYLYKAAIDNAVFQTELEKEIASRNIDVSDEEITVQVNIMADRSPTREAFYQSMERSGVTMEALREDVRRQIEMEKTITSAISGDPVSEDAMREFYDTMKPLLFRTPKGFMFDLIEVSSEITAKNMQAKISANSANWQEIISNDPRSSDIVRQSTEPLFFSELAISEDENMSFMLSLDIGEVGEVAEVSSNDYMIVIKRENREEADTPFEQVSLDIRSMLEQEQQRSAINRFRQDMMSRAVVEILDPSLFPAPENAEMNIVSVDAPIQSEDAEAASTDSSPDIATPEATAQPEAASSEPLPEVTVQPEATSSEPLPEVTVQPEVAPSESLPEVTVQPEVASSESLPEVTVQPEDAPSEPLPEVTVQPEAASSEPLPE